MDLTSENATEAGTGTDTATGTKREYATRTEAAYACLREEILEGALEPGEKLLLEKLRARYGFGASSLREALSKLSSERLVRMTGQRGYWVESISQAEHEDITDMRLFIEPEALLRSIDNENAEWAEAVTEAFTRLNRVEQHLHDQQGAANAEWEQENRAFHLALIGNCGSHWMLHFVAMLSEHSERYRRQAVARRAVPKEVLISEHRAIYDAAMNRQGRLAAELLRVHIANSAHSLAVTLFGQAGQDEGGRAATPPRRSGNHSGTRR